MNHCPICDTRREFLFEALVRNKYSAQYLVCPKCGLIQPADPIWIEEAYTNALADIDTGAVARNFRCIKVMSALIYFMFDKAGRFLDYGGGHGLFTRAMRDIGFDYYWYDKYGDNLFARGFEGNLEDPFHMISAMEVIEHILEPIPFIEPALKSAPNIIFTTELYQGAPPRPDGWHYYAFSSGQHVSFYKIDTLEYLAQKYGYHLLSNGFFHILSREKKVGKMFDVLNNKWIYNLTYIYVKKMMSSKTMTDNRYLIEKLRVQKHESDV